MYQETCPQACTMKALGEPLFKSRSSEIFSWQGNTLLKLFNANVDPALIANEEINTTETYEKGVSKVKCYGHIQIEDRTGIIIERVKGKTLISLAASKPHTAFKVPELMAKLQVNLHNTFTAKIRSYKEMVLNALSSEPLRFLSETEKTAVTEMLAALPDGNSILHLDYHPDNVMSDGEAATIIDWMTAARGVPAADVAATLYLLTEGEMIPGLNKTVAAVLETIRKLICKKYLAEYKKKTGMTDAEIARWRLPFLIVRLGVWNIDSEVNILQEKIRACLADRCSLREDYNPDNKNAKLSGYTKAQAAAAILECAGKLKAVGIGLEDALIAVRLTGDGFAVTAPKASLSEMGNCDVLFMDGQSLRKNSPLVYTVFLGNKKLCAFVRTHPYFCRLAAQSGQDIPPVLDDMAQIVGVYARVRAIEDQRRFLKALKKHYACLTSSSVPEGLGAVATGRSLHQAFAATLVLEKAAQAYYQARFLGGVKPVNLLEAKVMNFGYKFKYSQKAEVVTHRTATDYNRPISEREIALRRQIVELGKQLSDENLVQGTWGNISVRLDEEYMLCTPSGLDYFSILPYDIVRVKLGSLEYEGNVKPTGEKTFHAALLREHPDVTCIIHTHPVHCSVFAAAHEKILPANEEQRALLCGDVEVAKYGFPSTAKLSRNVVAAIKGNRACVMENHGMLVCGNSIEDAHEKCHVTEECARIALEKLSAQSLVHP